MSTQLCKDIRELEEAKKVEPSVKLPSNRPSEIVPTLMASHILDDRPDLTKQTFLVLDTIIVHPAYQRQEIATALLKHACRFASRHGLWLLTQAPESSGIVGLLRTVGFRILRGMSIDWAQSCRGAAGKEVYLTMAFDPRISPALVTEPKWP